MAIAHKLLVRRRVEWVAAATGVASAVTLAAWPSHWPFDARPPGGDASVWDFLLSDRLTLGFVRLSLVLLSLFVIASVPALFAAGRWLKGFAGGVAADDSVVSHLQRDIEELRQQLLRVTAQRDQALGELAQRADRGGDDTENVDG
jgi:hypothetical protein